MGCHLDIRRKGLAIASALCIWTTSMDLEVWIRRLAVEDLAGARGHARLTGGGILLLGLKQMCLGIGGGEVRLALLQVLDLAGGVLRADEATVQTSHFVALAGRILVLKLHKWRHHLSDALTACCDLDLIPLRTLAVYQDSRGGPWWPVDRVSIAATPSCCNMFSQGIWQSQSKKKTRCNVERTGGSGLTRNGCLMIVVLYCAFGTADTTDAR